MLNITAVWQSLIYIGCKKGIVLFNIKDPRQWKLWRGPNEHM